MRFNSSIAIMLLALSAPLACTASQLKPNELPTNIEGTTTIAAPQHDFDPLTASDQYLQFYGFPPRPDEIASPKGYASWKRAMLASKTRIMPVLKQTNHFSGPGKLAGKTMPAGKDSAVLYSNNWSGYVNLSGATNYSSSSFYFVYADFIVPTVIQAFGTCSGGWDYAVSWVGIDGWNSTDVLQAGFEDDAYCNGGSTATNYAPWYEWYPNPWTNIANLPISPGDNLFIEVWSTSSTTGTTFLLNRSTNQYSVISFSAPAGTTLQGNSAEWIVERPAINGSLATLANYVAEPFWSAYSITFSGSQYDPSSPSSYPTIGLDSSGNQDSSPTLLGSGAFLMQTGGLAF